MALEGEKEIDSTVSFSISNVMITRVLPGLKDVFKIESKYEVSFPIMVSSMNIDEETLIPAIRATIIRNWNYKNI